MKIALQLGLAMVMLTICSQLQGCGCDGEAAKNECEPKLIAAIFLDCTAMEAAAKCYDEKSCCDETIQTEGDPNKGKTVGAVVGKMATDKSCTISTCNR